MRLDWPNQLRNRWMLSRPMPGQTHLEVHSLVRVHDRRRGTVTKIDENKNVAENHPLRHQSCGRKNDAMFTRTICFVQMDALHWRF